jgi:hypothetical protein
MAKEEDMNAVKYIEEMITKKMGSFDYEELASNIRANKDDYSLIEDDFNGMADINEPSTVPFRWDQEDVGREMVIVDEIGLFGPQRVVELTLTYLKDDTIEFTIDKVTLFDIDHDDTFVIEDQEEFEHGGIVRLKRGEIISTDQLSQMNDFAYGIYSAPDHKDFGLFALVQYWAHHHVLVQNLHDVTERQAQAMLSSTDQIHA